MSFDPIAPLEASRLAEKEQALFYRVLSTLAEERGDGGLSERFQELHADEQHQLSRLTARLVELGHLPADVSAARGPDAALEGWEAVARGREEAEVRRYQELLALPFDESTRGLLEAILDVERSHAAELGGKWTMA